jgi:hypothetical protein
MTREPAGQLFHPFSVGRLEAGAEHRKVTCRIDHHGSSPPHRRI